jgi:Protein of unknown function (DUF3047)
VAECAAPWRVLAVGALCAMAQAAAAAGPGDARVGPGWRVVGWPDQRMPLTRYAGESVDGRLALRMDARASYGNLVHATPAQAPPRTVSWAWRMQQPNPSADVRVKPGDDAAAKVCLGFDMALQQVPFVERTLMRLARSRSADALPAATLCWVWGGPEAAGSVIANAYTRRVRYIVLRTAADPTGQWVTETRDVAADFRRAFGDESPDTPALTNVIVAADADNTGASTVAHVADLRFAP